MKTERRFLSTGAAPVQLEERADKPALIRGYAAVFFREDDRGTEFELWGDMVERIMPGAFDSALQRADDVRALFNHDPSLILGRAAAQTVRLSVDGVGLRYEIDPPDTQAARDLVESIRRGDVTGSSFAFSVVDERFVRDGDRQVREVRDVRLFDVGPVTYPAYGASQADVRELERRFASMVTKKRGQSLASLLNEQIDSMVEGDEDLNRGDVIRDMASAAGISPSTVQEILAAEIDCPPLQRLRGFAQVLPATLGQIRAAAERDGCSYGGDDEEDGERSSCGCPDIRAKRVDVRNRLEEIEREEAKRR